ncbi:MAG TPA: nickel-dependent hydrogenase large subunit [Stellaceae bacterium]|nr:nickel-dependent hydrogenase large subunit [Stellaceae bacterium]
MPDRMPELFRGLEVILCDKDAQAGLVVTPRACGICGASHLTCAAWALDTAWRTEFAMSRIDAEQAAETMRLLEELGEAQARLATS